MDRDQPELVAVRAGRSAERWWRGSWAVGLAYLFVTFIMLAALLLLTLFAGSWSEDPSADRTDRPEGVSWLATAWAVGLLLVVVVLVAFVKIDRRRRSGLVVLGGLGLTVTVIGWPWVADVLRPDLTPSGVHWAIFPIWAMGLMTIVVSAFALYRTRRYEDDPVEDQK